MAHFDFYLGIDPGVTGGIGLYSPYEVNGSKTWSIPLRERGIDALALADLLEDNLPDEPIHCVVEHVSSRPRQAGAFSFGITTGIIHGVLGALRLPFKTIPPSLWKPGMGLLRRPDETYDQNKDRARALATQLFPHLHQDFARKMDDGRAEALLMAVFAHHNYKKENPS